MCAHYTRTLESVQIRILDMIFTLQSKEFTRRTDDYEWLLLNPCYQAAMKCMMACWSQTKPISRTKNSIYKTIKCLFRLCINWFSNATFWRLLSVLVFCYREEIALCVYKHTQKFTRCYGCKYNAWRGTFEQIEVSWMMECSCVFDWLNELMLNLWAIRWSQSVMSMKWSCKSWI